MKRIIFRLSVSTLLLLISISLSSQFEILDTLQESRHEIFFADYSPDGKYIVTTGSDNNIILWNTQAGTIYRTLAGLKKRTNAAAFTQDGKTLITAGEDYLITIWNPNTIEVVATLRGHKWAVKTIDISPDNKLLASGGEDRYILIWDIANRLLLRKLTGHKKAVNSIMFSHDGKKLISGSADKTLKQWDVSTGSLLNSVTAHDGWIRCVEYSPDDKFIASGGDDNMIYIWQSSDLNKVGSLSGHTDWVQTLDFSPDGKYLISGGHDQRIILWDIIEKKIVQSSGEQEQIILSTKFSPDSRNFLTNELLSEKLRIWGGRYFEPLPGESLVKEMSTQRSEKAETEANIVKEPEGIKEETKVTAAGIVAPAIAEVSEPAVKYPRITLYAPVLESNRAISEQANTLIIGRVDDPDGINVLLINKVPVEVSEAGVFETSVSLKGGENAFDLVVINNTGRLNRRNFVIDCMAEVVTTDIPKIPEMYAGNYHALIIAVNEYDDPNIIDLDRPLQDAEKLKEVLIAKYIFDPQYIQFLKNPTRMEIIVALDELSRSITEKDNLLIFYAGHGYWDEKGAIGYWLPRDAMNNNTANWFRNSTMRDFIGSIKSKHTILIADACFSGSIFKSRSAFAEPPGGITKLYELTSRKAMTSGTLELVPDESIFLKYLIKRLDENAQQFLSSEELFSSLKTAVLNNSPNVPQFGTIQNVGDEGGDFIFIQK